jgi:hypothetical protein
VLLATAHKPMHTTQKVPPCSSHTVKRCTLAPSVHVFYGCIIDPDQDKGERIGTGGGETGGDDDYFSVGS